MDAQALFLIGFVAITTLVMCMLATGAVLWIGRLLGLVRINLCGDVSKDWLTRHPQPKPRWTVLEFLLFFGILLVTTSVLQPRPAETGSPSSDSESAWTEPTEGTSESTEDTTVAEAGVAKQSVASESDQKWMIATHTIANLVAVALTISFLRLVYGATLGSLTLVPTKRDLRVGLIATPWILVPVLGVNLVVIQFVEYEHAVTDLLADHADPVTFCLLFMSAAVVTPLAEEFQFRLLLQGGLQQLADPPAESGWEPRSFWPILVTSVLFAAMHLGQGAAPIPLFFLSIGLGLLYQRTGRLFPVIVVHMILNGSTLLSEFCRVNAGIISN
ncbi:MAG: CPBP family intramembrane glutamic endopeptidase [Planctomycetota bacterium]